MEPWVWLVAYLLAFAGLQLVLYQHFRRRDSTPDAGLGGGTYSAAEGERSESLEGEELRCTHCGALNEAAPTYTYCRNCTRPLE